MKLSSKLHDRTAMCEDVSGGHWSSCLRGGNKSWLSLVSFNRVLFCILVLWRKKCWLSIWLSLKKVAAVSGSCCPLHPLGSMLQALPGFSSSSLTAAGLFGNLWRWKTEWCKAPFRCVLVASDCMHQCLSFFTVLCLLVFFKEGLSGDCPNAVLLAQTEVYIHVEEMGKFWLARWKAGNKQKIVSP